MIISEKEQFDFENAVSCHICNKEYSNKDVPVRGPCHVTGKYRGKYRGSAHTKYNLSYRLTNKIYVIFHNLRGHARNWKI